MASASILRKTLMAFTGLIIFGFLVGHVAGNLTLFAGAETFNKYAKMLEDMPALVIGTDIVLLICFGLHFYNALKLTHENAAARPVKYGERQTMGQSTFASRTMWITGLVILLFVVVHVKMFKFGDKHVTVGGVEQLALYQLVIEEFKQPQVAIFYVFAMLCMGLHLSHAIASAIQTLGALKPGWRQPSRKYGLALGWGVSLLFAAMPLFAWLVAPAPIRPKADTIPITQTAPAAAPAAAPSAPPSRTP